MLSATSEIPQQPGVDVADQQLPCRRLLPGSVHVIEDPADLGPGEVRGQRQTHAGFVPIDATAERREPVADRLRAGVLPDDRVGHRSTGRPVPHDHRLALVRDPDRRDVRRVEVCLGKRTTHDLAGVAPDLECVVLDPAGPREDLLMLHLVCGDHQASPVEEHAARTRRALVDRGDELRHGSASLRASTGCELLILGVSNSKT